MALAAGLAACSGNGDNNNIANNSGNPLGTLTKDTAVHKDARNLPPRQQAQEMMFDRYLELKNALVAAKPDEAATAAKNMQIILDTVAVSDDAAAWGKDKAKMAADLLKITQAKKIGDMRAFFSSLSDEYYNAIGKYGIYTQRAYREFCPMAFDSKGAYWLSTSEKIENPYFGNDMLDCGEVRDTL
jgi:Cu(I)/Ag(I) efflux system membrane fusion protein